MKKIFIIALVSSLMFGCGDSSKESETHSDNVTTHESSVNSDVLANTTATFGIEGMTCAHGCAASIEKNLAELSGVKSAIVDFDTKIATISYNSNDVDDGDMVSLVEEMSDNQYKVQDLKVVSSEKEMNSELSGTEENGNILSTPSFEMPNLIDFFTNIL